MKQRVISHLKHAFIIIIAITIGTVLAFVAFHSAGSEKTTKADTPSYTQIENTKAPEQEYFYFIKDPKKKPIVGAESYFVGDLDTGEIIFGKNQDKQFPIASVSKLMTAVVSLESQIQDETTQITKEVLATEGQNGGFKVNEVIKINDLLYPLLLESSNDAAEAIAHHTERENFLNKMNEKSKALGMNTTSFSDPSGLSEKNQSTAFDLFKFAQHLKNEKPDLLQLTTKRNFDSGKHTWFNNSQFLKLDGYIGGKRGYINESKQTALSIFSLPLGIEGNRNIGITLLRSNDRLKDTQNILSFLNKNIYYGKDTDADMDWVKQKEGVLEEKEPNFVKLVFGGDIMLDRGVKSSVNKNFGGDYSALFEKLTILKDADITFANLEGPASDQGIDRHNLYSFRMNPSTIPALKGAGFHILSVANNHMGDWGRDAYKDTLARLKENEILYTGGGMTIREAEQPTIVEKYGMKIGYLGFSDVGPNMEPTEEKAGLLLASNPHFEEIIKNASTKVDFLVVSFHFGDEYKTVHNQRQEYLAYKAVDNGAKIVVGHHPHVIQDTEVYKDSLIIYSLGNLVFDQYFSENTMQGGLFEVKLWRDGTMDLTKNIVKLSRAFQPEKIIPGKLEKVKFQPMQKIEQ